MNNGDIILVLDTETTDMIDWKASLTAPHQPELIQLGLMLIRIDSELPKGYQTLTELGYLITHERVSVSAGAFSAHGLSENLIKSFGYAPHFVDQQLKVIISQANLIVCHNTDFDLKVLRTFGYRYSPDLIDLIDRKPSFCTMKNTSNLCKINNKWNSGYKWPTLQELHRHLMGYSFEGAHDALSDVRATVTCLVNLPKTFQYTLNSDDEL